MNKQMKGELYKLVQEKCKNYDKHFGHTDVWRYHIKLVVDNAMFLATKYGADMEIVELSALLHDIASLEDLEKYGETHHIVGSQMAEEILAKYGYPKDRIERVKGCILNHRASAPAQKAMIEEICVADADALAHIQAVAELLMWRAYLGESVEEGCAFVKHKISKSYNKMSQQSQELYKDKFSATMQLFDFL